MAIDIKDYVLAGYSCLYVRTTEQERALNEIVASIDSMGLADQMSLFVWKCTTGLYPYTSDKPTEDAVAQDFVESLMYMSTSDKGWPHKNRIYIMFNPKEFLASNPIARQALRDAAFSIKNYGTHIILVGAGFDCPEELSEVITFVDFDLPTKQELREVFRGMTDYYKQSLDLDISEDLLEKAAENATGLTMLKAENAISMSIVGSKGVDIKLLRKEKQLAVKQSGVIEYMPVNEDMDSLGGFDNLKAHVSRRRRYFEDHKKALEFGLKPPKGIMLIGNSGTGKTLSAKCVATALNLPLYRLDVGALFQGIVGSSEQATKDALKLLDSIAPACLLIDEAEKLLSGLESSGKSDSGVTSRIIGALLTWMSETTSPIYKVATCNTIRGLDGAMFRRGRWDEVFGVDLPNEEERKQIYSIHLKKRGRNPEVFDLVKLAEASDGFVGAEIESAVDESLYVAFDKDVDVDTAILLDVTKKLVPISKTDKENMDQFRRWMEGRAVPVSTPIKAVKAGRVGTERKLRVTSNN